MNNTSKARVEKQVGEELERLHEIAFHDFHTKEMGEANVDHLIVEREGVFAVETKSWQGTITFDRDREGVEA